MNAVKANIRCEWMLCLNQHVHCNIIEGALLQPCCLTILCPQRSQIGTEKINQLSETRTDLVHLAIARCLELLVAPEVELSVTDAWQLKISVRT
jgi:hypothetical protein